MTTVPALRPSSLVGWAVAVLVSAWATYYAAQAPPPRPSHPLPPALPRPPTEAELAELTARATQLVEELQAARQRRGSPLPIEQWEERDDQGAPWLPHGIPDNPLTPSVSWVLPYCGQGPLPSPPPDWTYCAETASLAASGTTLVWNLARTPNPDPPDALARPQGSGNE